MIHKTALELKIEEEATIKEFLDENAACRLLTLGVLPKMRIKLMQRSPFGGAICVKLGSTLIAIRNQEALNIILE